MPVDSCDVMGAKKGKDEMLMASAPDQEPGYGSLDGTSREDYAHMTRHEMLLHTRRRLLIAATLCFVVMIAEITGGYIAGSLAVMTDAAHMMTDFVSFVVALLAICLARKKPSKKLTHGWYRAEIIGALFSVLLIWVLTGVLIFLGIKRSMSEHLEIDADIMIITASIALGVNIILGLVLHLRCDENNPCSPSLPVIGAHDHDHENVNLRAATLHVIGDIIQSLSILIGAIVIYFRPDLTIIDPILTIVFSVLVFLTTCRLFRDIIMVLMEAKPSSLDYSDVRRRLVEIDGVEGVHSLRIWALTTGVNVMSAHLVIATLYDGAPVNARGILKEARHIIETTFGVLNSTIQIEYSDDGMAFVCARTPSPSD
ncbi:zinc transporter 2-like isoform X1 [Asterias rubens]|uniref:zinc transporter 2-like isoform X1 n=2 Tax=Asterias rubens TaxID=7604 RepID=UPI001455BE37|nr:zinc transporter 2-like isoform X1 [Asterias rubens]